MKYPKYWLILLLIVLAVLVVPTVVANVPTGIGPNDPLNADGTWQSVPANGTLWYYFDYFGDKSKVEVDLDMYAAPNVQMAILTPDLATAFVQDPTTIPIGWGTPPGAATQSANHDLVWLGGFNFGGRFFAVVINKNANPVPVRAIISGLNVVVAPTLLPTANPLLALPNPFVTPIPTGTLSGKLVFQEASGGNIYTVNGDGSNLERVTHGLDPNWSSDGTKIAFARWDAPMGLFIVNSDGSNEQMIYATNQPLSPQWSPDGTKIAFTRQSGGSSDGKSVCFRGACFASGGDPHWKLGVVDLNSNLTDPPGSYHSFSPTWSVDNRTLAFADAGFGILETDTTSQTTPVWNLFTENTDVQSTVFNPDGTKLAFMVKQHDHWEINWMNAAGSNVTAVTFADPLSFTVVNNVAPTWSPDGKQILFLSDRSGKWEFYVINLDGSGLTQVLKNITDSVKVSYNFSNERVIDWTK